MHLGLPHKSVARELKLASQLLPHHGGHRCDLRICPTQRPRQSLATGQGSGEPISPSLIHWLLIRHAGRRGASVLCSSATAWPGPGPSLWGGGGQCIEPEPAQRPLCHSLPTRPPALTDVTSLPRAGSWPGCWPESQGPSLRADRLRSSLKEDQLGPGSSFCF